MKHIYINIYEIVVLNENNTNTHTQKGKKKTFTRIQREN